MNIQVSSLPHTVNGIAEDRAAGITADLFETALTKKYLFWLLDFYL